MPLTRQIALLQNLLLEKYGDLSSAIVKNHSYGKRRLLFIDIESIKVEMKALLDEQQFRLRVVY